MPLSVSEVESAVAEMLGVPVVRAAPVGRGYANENWHVVCEDRELLVKVAPLGTDLGKAESASRAVRLAVAGGAPVPRELFFDAACAAFGGRLVRIFEFVAGVHPESVLATPQAIVAFFESFGQAVGQLHAIQCEGFSSRVGGSAIAPTFRTWSEYVAYRIPQIRQRAVHTDLYSPAEFQAMFDEAQRLAAEVSPVVEARLTHRDLYLDNVLASGDHQVAAIIDFDNAEPWDPAADQVKLRWQVFPQYDGAAEAYGVGYRAVVGAVPMLEERVRVAEILELSNHAVGAQLAGSPNFAAASKRRLDRVLAQYQGRPLSGMQPSWTNPAARD